MEVIDRIVATNEANAFDGTLYRQVFYALGQLIDNRYDDLCKIDSKLIDPIHRYKFVAGAYGDPAINTLHYILETYHIDALEKVADILEYESSLIYDDDGQILY